MAHKIEAPLRGEKREFPSSDERTGPRTWLMAVLAAVSTQDPELVLRVGPFVSILVILTGKPGNFRVDSPVILSSTFVLWSLASSFWAPFSAESAQAAFAMGAAVVLFLAVLDLVRSLPQLRLIASGFVVGACLTVLQVITQNSGDFGGPERLSLEGLNQNYLGYSLATGFAMVTLLWMTCKHSKVERAALIVGAVGLVVGVEATGTRGAYASIVFIGIWLATCRLGRHAPIAPLLFLITGGFLIISIGRWDPLLSSLEFGDRATGDWSGRLLLWPAARELWSDNFLFGVGYAGFGYVTDFGIGAHNAVLQIGTGTGVVGVLLFTGVWVSSLRASIRRGGPVAAILVGAFLAAVMPAYLTGFWESAPAAWIALAIFSRLGVVAGTQISGRNPFPHERRRRA